MGTDKYTQYPEHLRLRVEAVDKFITDTPRFRAWWDALPDEEKQRLDALPPEERQAEIAKLRGDPASPNPPPNDNLPSADSEVNRLKAELEKAEQRYRTLQGMSKESGELEKQNNFLLGQIKFLQDQIHDLQEIKKDKPAAATAVAKPDTKKITVREALKAHYDSLAEDLAPEILEKEIKKDERLFELASETFREAADQRISEVAAKFDGEFKLSKEQQFYRDLDSWGDWKAMWPTPEFQAFLGDEADVTGVERYAIISDAFARLDSRVVLKAFNLFTGKNRKEAVNTDKTKIDAAKITNRLGAPRSSGASTPGVDNQPTLSPLQARKALAELSANYSRGLFKGNKDEYDKEYARLFAIIKGGTT